MTLPVEEFLRRFLLHLLPRDFVRIRNFGFLANRQRATLLPLCFGLLQRSAMISPSTTASTATDHPHSLWNCPVCGGAMHVVERVLRSSTPALISALGLVRRMNQQSQPQLILAPWCVQRFMSLIHLRPPYQLRLNGSWDILRGCRHTSLKGAPVYLN
jgi:hypothetical protein